MPVKCLTPEQISNVISLFDDGYTQKHIASLFHVSPRTIGRILYGKGILPSKKKTPTKTVDRTESILKVVDEYGIDAQQLKEALEAPALTTDNIAIFLGNQSRETVATLFYQVELQRTIKAIQDGSVKVPEGDAHETA